MLKLAVLISGVFMGSMALAQETNGIEKRCEALISGQQKVYLRNEILKQKDLLFSSDLMTKYCPGMRTMKTEEEKVSAAIRVMASYSWGESMCNGKAISVQQKSKAKVGGYYSLPLSYDERSKGALKDTPCDVSELTPANQATCAVYLAQIPEGQEGAIAGYSTANRVGRISGLRSSFGTAMKVMAPNCFPQAQVNKVAPGSITAPAAPVNGSDKSQGGSR
jgi:hypothetical protein